MSDQKTQFRLTLVGDHDTILPLAKHAEALGISPIVVDVMIAESTLDMPCPTQNGYGSSRSRFYFRRGKRKFNAMANPPGDLNHG